MDRATLSANTSRWWQQGHRSALAGLRHRPPVVTLAFVVVIASIWARLEVGGQLPTTRFVAGAFSPRAVIQGRYSTLLTSTLLCRDIFMVISICISLLATMGTYEVVAGHIRAACLAVFAAVVGPLSILGGLSMLDLFGSTWARGRLETLDIGASAIVAASSGALAAIARYRPLTIGLVLFLISGLFVHHQLADWEHVLIFPWGYLAGHVFGSGAVRHPSRARRESARLATYGLAWAALLAFGVVACSHVLPPNKVYHPPAGTVISAPRIVQTSYPTPSMGGSRAVIVMLPSGYDSNPGQRYPVIELLHGDPGAPTSMITAAALETAQSAPGVGPFIGIAPNGNGPSRTFNWWANTPGVAMGTAVTTDLRAWVAAHYRTNNLWSFAGLSSGGFGAAYLPLISKQPVHAVCALSGYFDGKIPITKNRGPAAEKALSLDRHAADEPSLIFVAYGSSDTRTKPGSLVFIADLHKAHKNVVVRTYPGGHSWSVWKAGFAACFKLVAPAKI